jgi:hypothetical protein
MQWENNKCNAIGERPLDFEFNSLKMDILEPPYRESISWILKDVLWC